MTRISVRPTTLRTPALPALAAALALALPGATGRADEIHGDDVIIPEGSLCVGFGCFDGEIFGNDTIRMKKDIVRLHFWDTSVAGPTADWRLIANDDGQDGREYFALDEGAEEGNHIVYVEAGARKHAVFVAKNGSVGFGTASPLNGLHYVSGFLPSLTLEQDGSGGSTPQTWRITGSHSAFHLADDSAGNPFVLRVQTGAPDHSLVIANTGSLGLGTASPSVGLHMIRSDGQAQVLVEETNATAIPRDLMKLYNNGRPEIVLGNTATSNEWSFGAGTNLVMKTGALGTPSSTKTKHLTLYGASGDLEITGSIITGGPHCSTGCDAVFSDDYDLPSIQEHAAAMYHLGHLPNVGPTGPQTPVNLTDKLGRVLNELEYAHIYIAELEGEVRRIPDLEARLERLEALLAAD